LVKRGQEHDGATGCARGFGGRCGGAALGLRVVGGNSYRFKVTVEVETTEGLKTGSSVYEVSAVNRPKLLPEEGARQIEQKGEAVVVDLDSGPIFVLMSGRNLRPTDIVALSMRTLDPEFKGWTDSVESAGRLRSWSERKGEVSSTDWPMMVQFGDLNDPTSVEKVDPATFGVKRMWVETTNEDVTVGIEKRLRWLTEIKGGYLHGGFSARGAPLGLTGLAFSTEVGK
jgi:hypothetical protein